MRNQYLRKSLVEFLRTERAKQLANGATCAFDESNTIRALELSYEGSSIVNPLRAESHRKLQSLIDNPTQPVCTGWHEPGEKCDLQHVDDTAVARPRLLDSIEWFRLPDAEQRHYRGQHCRGRISLYRDRDGEFAVWSDGDPTKGGAWDVSEEIDIETAKRLLAQRATASAAT